MLKIAVLASGSGSNLQSIIDNIQAGKLDAQIQLVLSDKSNAYALKRAASAGIKTCYMNPKDYDDRVSYDKALAEEVKASGAELVVLAGFMRILNKVFLEEFNNRVINIHPALLPSFPGLHAQDQAWAYGVKVSGCTVHFVDCGTDTGPIIAQRAVPVLDTDTADDLAKRILVEEHKIYPYIIQMIAEGKVWLINNKVKINEA
ncbi:MAG: phosphoribosylglycinamide formyltransferase [Clostridia bacterium]|jgi:phosphoribosylglycinamide formyltransferase-1|nr:phosphoribosylglycinamide formyltransferase [Clostridia bacterium]MDD4571502.1 phosphoribosylglycinamide formyltransferase [Clostridia bacterium]